MTSGIRLDRSFVSILASSSLSHAVFFTSLTPLSVNVDISITVTPSSR